MNNRFKKVKFHLLDSDSYIEYGSTLRLNPDPPGSETLVTMLIKQ